MAGGGGEGYCLSKMVVYIIAKYTLLSQTKELGKHLRTKTCKCRLSLEIFAQQQTILGLKVIKRIRTIISLDCTYCKSC